MSPDAREIQEQLEAEEQEEYHPEDPALDWHWTLPSRVEAIEYLLSGDRMDRPTPNLEEDS